MCADITLEFDKLPVLFFMMSTSSPVPLLLPVTFYGRQPKRYCSLNTKLQLHGADHSHEIPSVFCTGNLGYICLVFCLAPFVYKLQYNCYRSITKLQLVQDADYSQEVSSVLVILVTSAYCLVWPHLLSSLLI